MERFNTGVNEYAIGLPSETEQEALKAEGYTHMSNGETVPDDGSKPEKYQIWIK